MLGAFETANSTLSEELYEEAKLAFQQAQRGSKLISFEVVPLPLRSWPRCSTK